MLVVIICFFLLSGEGDEHGQASEPGEQRVDDGPVGWVRRPVCAGVEVSVL
jgi:hypothetical protein